MFCNVGKKRDTAKYYVSGYNHLILSLTYAKIDTSKMGYCSNRVWHYVAIWAFVEKAIPECIVQHLRYCYILQ